MNEGDDPVVDLTSEADAVYLELGAAELGAADAATSPLLVAARESLSDRATWAEPPQSTKASVIDAIVAEAGQRATLESSQTLGTPGAFGATRPARSQTWQILGTVAATLALIAGVFGAGLQIGSQGPPSFDIAITMTATELAPDATGYSTLTETPSGIEIVLDTSDLPPAEDGEYYQGWLRTKDGVGVTIGTFHARGDDTIVLWSGLSLDDIAAITVTTQRVADGPASSGEVVLKAVLE